MTLLEKLAGVIAGQIKLDPDNKQVLYYGLQVFSLSIIGIVAVLVMGWLLNCLKESVAAMVTVALLRSFAGGAHCTAPGRCTAVTALAFSFLGRTAVFLGSLKVFNLSLFIVAIFLITMVVVLQKAPVASPAKPILTEKHKRRLRTLSFCAVSGLFVLLLAAQYFSILERGTIIAAALGMLWETFILTGPGHRVIAYIDGFLKKIQWKGG